MRNYLPDDAYFAGLMDGEGTFSIQGRFPRELSKRALLIPAAEALLPHLRIKRDIAERFLDALDKFPERRAHGRGERSWDVDTALAVADIALGLNPGAGSNRKRSPAVVRQRIIATFAEAA